MALHDQLRELALGCGFSQVGELRTDTIQLRREVREACAADKCKAYNKSWSCPPACGTLEVCEKRIQQSTGGLILQTSGRLEDSLDYEGMLKIAEDHGEYLKNFQEKLNTRYPAGAYLLLGNGPCKNCESCTYPESPCRFPGRMIISMEAMGMLVSDVCKNNNLPYYYGPNTLTYIGCVLI